MVRLRSFLFLDACGRMGAMPVLTNVTILHRQMTLLPPDGHGGGQLVDTWLLFKGDQLFDLWIKMA